MKSPQPTWVLHFRAISVGVMAACLVFGGMDALQFRLQSYEFIPHQFWLAVAIVAVAYPVVTRLWRRRASAGAVGTVVGLAAVAVGVLLFLAAPRWSVPSQLWLAMPYVFALLALAGLVGRVRMPTSLAVPYLRGGEV